MTDNDDQNRLASLRVGIVRDRIVDVAVESLAELPPVDLLVLAVPARAILHMLDRLPATHPDGCRVFDLGSTKGAITTAMDGLPPQFAAIGGHPMCGKPTLRVTTDLAADVLAIIAAVGAHPVWMDAADHDAAIAAVSHLPAVLSAALMRSAADEELWPVSASGFRDTARLAGTDPRMMLDILLTNRDAILAALACFESELAAARFALESADEEVLIEWLAAAQVTYAAYRRFKSAQYLLPPARSPNPPDGGIA
ncbi:MAG: hypothetical protein DCC51_08650 [Anaerolineae bacterium]|nr:MAG: hypothetical protein DCC51_08650 [Anaerolineae bacterium]